MFCQNCSAENAEDDRFCCQCGSPLRVEEQESSIEKRHTGRTIVFILAIVLGIMAAACGIFWWDREFPRQEQRYKRNIIRQRREKQTVRKVTYIHLQKK